VRAVIVHKRGVERVEGMQLLYTNGVWSGVRAVTVRQLLYTNGVWSEVRAVTVHTRGVERGGGSYCTQTGCGVR